MLKRKHLRLMGAQTEDMLQFAESGKGTLLYRLLEMLSLQIEHQLKAAKAKKTLRKTHSAMSLH